MVLCRVCHIHLHNSEKMGFSKKRWVKLHCKKIYQLQKDIKYDKRKEKRPGLLERARRKALKHYAAQRNTHAVKELSKLAPKQEKKVKSLEKAWKKAHTI